MVEFEFAPPAGPAFKAPLTRNKKSVSEPKMAAGVGKDLVDR